MRHTIVEWQMMTGIKIHNPSGFKGKRQNIYSQKYRENTFRNCARKSYITVRTNKGLKFLSGNLTFAGRW